jgi:hypothetical protein
LNFIEGLQFFEIAELRSVVMYVEVDVTFIDFIVDDVVLKTGDLRHFFAEIVQELVDFVATLFNHLMRRPTQ